MVSKLSNNGQPSAAPSGVASPIAGCNSRDIALVLIAHGDRGTAPQTLPPNQALLRHCTALAETSRFRTVTAGVLKGSPTLEEALARAIAAKPAAIALYPFFMADGYFVKTVLRQRLSDIALAVPLHVTPALGLDPKLAPIMLEEAYRAGAKAGLNPQDSRLIVVGHGSKFGPESAAATRQVADAMRAMEQFGEVTVAFLEEAPFLSNQMADSGQPTIVIGFFNGDGLHAGQDVPAAIAAAATGAIYTGPIGVVPEIQHLMQEAVLSSL